MKTFRCVCGNTVHFDNIQCLACGRELGFVPEQRAMAAIEPADEPGQWRALLPQVEGQRFRKCRNYVDYNVCNWLVDAQDPQPFCVSCRLSEVIPDLSKPDNHVLWYRTERAKRRLVYDLMRLGLPIAGKDRDPNHGLAFRFLEDNEDSGEFSDPGGGVTTGHVNGLITINLAEAVTSEREKVREQLNEPYRTLLGHFRHEVGHYYWDRLVRHSAWLDEFRQVFGDETQDYAAMLSRHYEQGPPADWQDDHISAYAAAHPWEDWAESWAHYLHIQSTLETARDYELTVRKAVFEWRPRPGGGGPGSVSAPDQAFFDLLGDWHALVLALNALNRSMGLPEAYPFALSDPAIEKLYLVHRVITQAARH